jgi:hypothetical protein
MENGVAPVSTLIVSKTDPVHESNAMNEFIKRYAGVILGVLSGFDRLLFRGSMRHLSYVDGFFKFLNWKRIKLVEFEAFCSRVTSSVQAAAERLAKDVGCPSLYVRSAQASKEELARQQAERTGPRGPHGLVCVLRCVEPCLSYELHRNAQTKQLDLQLTQRKCLHYYFYFQHPQFGWMHIRIQSWLPLTVRVCLNGREWLARQMAAAGLSFVQQENCFVQLSDFQQAQTLADAQLRTDWVAMLRELLAIVHPPQDVLYPDGWPYYWSAEQTEWATDVLFRSPADLQKCYPHFLRHTAFDVACADVLRFLGRKLRASGEIRENFSGEVQSTLKSRPEGTRIKHQFHANWLKMYDKRGVILRTETTINNTREFKTYRTAETDPKGTPTWRPMRKGVADLYRRAEVSQAANNRYLQELAAVESAETLGETAAPVCHRVQWHHRTVRALNPLGADAPLLEIISRAEFAINGFRNADLRQLLYGHAPPGSATAKKQAAATTRQLRLLRAHGLIQKVPRTHRYTVTNQGATIITALLAARRSSTANQIQLSV